MNADDPIETTLAGIVTFVKVLFSSNALYPMAVTGLPSISDGIVTFSSLPVYPVIVTLSPLISYVKLSIGVSPALISTNVFI